MLLVGSVMFLWFAPGSYQVYKALHVVAAVIWVGGDVTLTTLGIVFERRNDGPTLAGAREDGHVGRARASTRLRCSPC